MPYVPVSVNLGRVPKLQNGKHQISGNVTIYIKDGQKHRHPGPAEVHRDGYKAWFWMGLRHRKGKPAVIYADGTEEYWENGKFIKRVPEKKKFKKSK
jgi:hypothetical protein